MSSNLLHIGTISPLLIYRFSKFWMLRFRKDRRGKGSGQGASRRRQAQGPEG